MKGWKYESYRHSLAARGVRSSFYGVKGMRPWRDKVSEKQESLLMKFNIYKAMDVADVAYDDAGEPALILVSGSLDSSEGYSMPVYEIRGKYGSVLWSLDREKDEDLKKKDIDPKEEYFRRDGLAMQKFEEFAKQKGLKTK